MKYFLHTLDHIRIINGHTEWNGTPERFQVLEPEYPGLPEGIESRYWTPERAFFADGSYDGHNCEPYCNKVSEYTAYPEIYADVTLSQDTLCVSDPNDSITFSATLKDANSSIIPLDYEWIIRLTHEQQGDIDHIRLIFTQGSCSAVYTALDLLHMGTYILDENKFDLVDLNGTLYKIVLTNPVTFTIYRTL